jgi:uncharacterized protein (DUF983 family)
MVINKKEDISIRCRKCNSGQVYIRIKNKERVCKTCGFIDPNFLRGNKNGYE